MRLSEKIIVSVLLLGQFVISPFIVDFLPFSTFPMFSDVPERIFILLPGEGINYSNFDKIALEIFPYYANPNPKLSRLVPAIKLEEFDTFPKDYLKNYFQEFSLSGQVQRVEIGPISHNRVGILSVKNWDFKGD